MDRSVTTLGAYCGANAVQYCTAMSRTDVSDPQSDEHGFGNQQQPPPSGLFYFVTSWILFVEGVSGEWFLRGFSEVQPVL